MVNDMRCSVLHNMDLTFSIQPLVFTVCRFSSLKGAGIDLTMYILVVVSFISIYLGKNTNTQLQWHPLSSFALVRVHIQNSNGQAQVDMGTNLGEEGEGGGSLECPHVVAVFLFFFPL